MAGIEGEDRPDGMGRGRRPADRSSADRGAADRGAADQGPDEDAAARDRERERYARGLPDYHDPTAGWGGAPPARSALTLRLVLAVFGLVAGLLLAVWAMRVDAPGWLVALPIIMAVTAVVDIVVVARRKRRGEPG